MINLFLIKNKLKNKTNIQNNNNEIIEKYKRIAQSGNEEVIKEFYTNIEKGLTEKEAEQRLEKDGENIVIKEEEHSWFYFFINSFKDKFILILVILAIINQLVSSDNIGTIIIFAIGFVSAMIRFIQDYSTYKFNQKLKSQLFSNATVVRNGREKIIKTEKVVKGDIIHLNAGAIIPADVMIVENRDLFLNQSVFTGESAPVEKTEKYADTNEIFSLSNICLMGTSVISGKATAVVINTGFSTYLGSMGKQINSKKEITNFERGMNNITKLLIRYMVVVSIAVFVIYAFIRKDVLEAILFALSVAVGITPTMLPMIVNVNLTKGTKTLAKKKTLVKNIQSIQNLGAIDILCTDKTGTLTLDKIILQKYINVEGKEDLSILEYAFLNSYYGTGMKNLVDRAVIAYGNQHQIKDKIADYEKVDEIPFDYTRKKMSVVVEHEGHYRIITKGALEEVLKSCTTVKINNQHEPLTQELIENINTNAQKLAKLCIITVIIVMLISCKFKYGVLVIGSGSMTGTINKGDIILYEKYKNTDDIKVGNIIVFYEDDIKVIHRIIDQKLMGEETRYYTKGDANQKQDEGYRETKDIIGQVKARIPYMGWFTLWINDWRK